MSRHTYRCGVCNLNWPFRTAFANCPQCSEPCRGCRFLDATYAMTIEESKTYCEAHELDWPLAAHISGPTGNKTPMKQPKALTVSLEDRMAELHRDMDRWAHEVPHWLRSKS